MTKVITTDRNLRITPSGQAVPIQLGLGTMTKVITKAIERDTEMNTYVSKWAKGDTVHIDGKCYLLTGKPKKAIDGSWVVFISDTNGKVSMTYVRENLSPNEGK